MRSLLLLLPLCLLACTALDTEEKTRLASYQRNAALYFDKAKYDQALGVIDRGLELEPWDYKLRTLRASIFLRLSGPAAGRDQRMLDQSLETFAEVFADRSLRRHDSPMLFYYALARQKQGLRLLAEAARIDRKQPDAEERIAELDAAADAENAAARELFATLLHRGDYKRLCHYHLLQIAAADQDRTTILAQGAEYLTASAAEQDKLTKEIDRTMTYGYEVDQKQQLAQRRAEEIEVRTLMAQQLYLQRDWSDALAHVEAVLKLDPTRSDDHYNRGLLLRELGRVDEAKADLRTFLATTSLPPDSPKVVDAVKVLTQ
jgi:regulator of sirC expression with transglutaminase-like and TPR domain